MPIDKVVKVVIRIPQVSETSNLDKDDKIRSLDKLVESLCESYNIPSSKVEEMRSGLEDALSSYLNEFLSNNSSSNDEIIRLDRSVGLDRILECIRLHNSVILYECQSPLIEFANNPDGIKYKFLRMDVSSVPTDLLIESWNCKDAKELSPLITYILARKES